MANLSFGNLVPTNASIPYRIGKPASAPSPTLTFGGAYLPVSDPTLAIFKGGNTFGPSVPKATNSGGVLGGLSNFLGGFSMGTPVNNIQGGRGNNPGGTFVQWGEAVAAGMVGQNTPQIKTAAVDGSTSWVSGLRESLGGILDFMGSTGDSSGQPVVTPVSYTEEGTNWPLIVAALAAAGLAVYAYQSNK